MSERETGSNRDRERERMSEGEKEIVRYRMASRYIDWEIDED